MGAPPLHELEIMMDAAWRAPDRSESNGWVLRAASGVTQRANSVWAREPGSDSQAQHAALRAARLWYRDRRLPLIFQVFDDSRSADLNAVLDEEGFTRQSETVIMSRGRSAPYEAPDPTPAVEISQLPSEEWLQLWWSVDGRGGPAEREVARAVLTGCPSVYALVRSDDGVPAAVGRLALPRGAAASGGIYCMATRQDARRRGLAGRVLQELLSQGALHGVGGYWLLVTAANHGARQLYAGAGFREAGRYLYRQDRPKRHLTGC
ncbi:GNAT family N-acetyltransferase [Pseudarthrobacter sp. TAF60_1]|uniref:GNAT family N-acetyltransferase n=1 Tax=Pseudarthrobacter sp. TAF60_1 TaxID=3233071 RepID=UPI003F96B7DF